MSIFKKLFHRKKHVLFIPEGMCEMFDSECVLKKEGIQIVMYSSSYGRDLPFIITKNGEAKVLDIFTH